MDSNQRGRFAVAIPLLDEDDFKDQFLPRVRVLGMEKFDAHYVVYDALCDDFDQLGEGEGVPFYEWIVTKRDGKSLEFKAARVVGSHRFARIAA